MISDAAVERELQRMADEGLYLNACLLAIRLVPQLELELLNERSLRSAERYLERVVYHFGCRRRGLKPRVPAQRSTNLSRADYDRLWELARRVEERCESLLRDIAQAAGRPREDTTWAAAEAYAPHLGFMSEIQPSRRERPSLLAERLALR